MSSAGKEGRQGYRGNFHEEDLEYVRKKITKNAGWALGLAALMPPPFPFTPFVAAAAVLQYPRKKLLATVALGRFWAVFCRRFAGSLVGQKDSALGPVSRHVLHGSRNLGLVTSWEQDSGFYSWFKQSRAEPERLRLGTNAIGSVTLDLC